MKVIRTNFFKWVHIPKDDTTNPFFGALSHYKKVSRKKLYGTSKISIWLCLVKLGYFGLFKKYFLNTRSHLDTFINDFITTEERVTQIEYVHLSKYQYYLNYKGYRHMRGLPVNGQRTVSNAKSARSIKFHKKLLFIARLVEKNLLDEV